MYYRWFDLKYFSLPNLSWLYNTNSVLVLPFNRRLKNASEKEQNYWFVWRRSHLLFGHPTKPKNSWKIRERFYIRSSLNRKSASAVFQNWSLSCSVSYSFWFRETYTWARQVSFAIWIPKLNFCTPDDDEHSRQVSQIIAENSDMLDSFTTVSKELTILQTKLRTSLLPVEVCTRNFFPR